jgi:hypothetical protein
MIDAPSYECGVGLIVVIARGLRHGEAITSVVSF